MGAWLSYKGLGVEAKQEEVCTASTTVYRPQQASVDGTAPSLPSSLRADNSQTILTLFFWEEELEMQRSDLEIERQKRDRERQTERQTEIQTHTEKQASRLLQIECLGPPKFTQGNPTPAPW